jgi:hypothetical protein
MRILSLIVFAGVLGVTSPAGADGVVNDCQPNSDSSGCSCEHDQFHTCNGGPDMSIVPIRDMSRRDLASPSDSGSPPDARRERRHRQHGAQGRGLILLSGVSTLAVIALRRRYKTSSPTPADSALAASDTRKDS